MAVTDIMIPGIMIPGITVRGVLASIWDSPTDGAGIVLTIPAGIMEGIILIMEVTGLDITGVTGTDTGIAITGVADIILTTFPAQIMVMHMAGIIQTEEGYQGMDITRPMNIITDRLVAEEMITSSAHGVREPQPLPKVLQRVQDHPQPIQRSVIQDEVPQLLAGIPVQLQEVEIIILQTEQQICKVVQLT